MPQGSSSTRCWLAPITRMVTGKLPSDPKFQQEWIAFLDQPGALLVAADADS